MERMEKLFMISRYSYKWVEPIKRCTPIKIDYELCTKIVPVSFNDDKSVKEYVEKEFYIERKSKWSDYIKSFDIGSPSEQVLNHLTKGTPLVTTHTLPHADFTQLSKGAEALKFLRDKGITLDMLDRALREEIKNDVVIDKKDGDE